jgi:hypothetical protein
LGFELFPFKIHTLPDIFRGGEDVNSTNWCTVRVRGGFVWTTTVSTSSYVNGTDMMQNVAYRDIYAVPSSSWDITLPTGSAQNPTYFWIEVNTSISGSSPSSSYWLRYGNNPVSSSVGNPTPWTSFPNQSSNYIPIGYVDCYTSSSVKQAIIRQVLETDVLSSGGGFNYHHINNDFSNSFQAGTVYYWDPNGNYTSSYTSTPPLFTGLWYCSNNINAPSGTRIYPTYPVPPSASWHPMTPMIPITLCVNGQSTNYFGCLIPSGSYPSQSLI